MAITGGPDNMAAAFYRITRGVVYATASILTVIDFAPIVGRWVRFILTDPSGQRLIDQVSAASVRLTCGRRVVELENNFAGSWERLDVVHRRCRLCS